MLDPTPGKAGLCLAQTNFDRSGDPDIVYKKAVHGGISGHRLISLQTDRLRSEMSLRVTKKCLSAPVTLQQFRFRQCSTAAPPIVFKTYDDGLVLQQSTKEDSKQINEWWSEQENYPVSQNEMDLPIELYGKAYPKCSISGRLQFYYILTRYLFNLLPEVYIT